jgi:hypothetical protein
VRKAVPISWGESSWIVDALDGDVALIGPAAALVAGGNRRHAATIFNELTGVSANLSFIWSIP